MYKMNLKPSLSQFSTLVEVSAVEYNETITLLCKTNFSFLSKYYWIYEAMFDVPVSKTKTTQGVFRYCLSDI